MSNKIKIGYIGHRTESGSTNGIDSHIFDLMNRVACDDRYKVYSYCGEGCSRDDERWVRINTVFPKNSIFRPLNGLMGAILLRLKGVKVLHMHGLNCALFLPIIRMFFNNIVFTFHSNDWMYPKWNFLEKSIIYFSYIMMKISRVNEVYVSRNFYEVYGGKSSYLIYNGSFEGEEDFCVSPNGELNTIVIVGRITPEKAQLELAKKLAGTVFCVEFYGSISNDPYSRKFIDVIEKSSNLKYFGVVDNKTLRDRLTNVIYINASLYEGLSIANVEGAVISPVSFFSDIPANLELMLPEENYFSDLAELSEKLKNPHAYAINCEIKRRLYNNFSWSECLKELKCIYEK